MKKNKFIIILNILICLSIAIILFVKFTFKVDENKINNEKVFNYNQGWKYLNNNIDLPTKIDIGKGQELVISNILPENFCEGMTLCIRTSEQTLKVEVDGETIFTYGIYNERTFGKSPGSSWNLIRLPHGLEGKRIVLRIESPYKDFSGNINGITYGSKNANIFMILKQNIVGFSISSLILLIGIITLIVYYITNKKLYLNQNVLLFSQFIILLSIWLFSESKLLQLLIENQNIVSMLGFISLMLFPIPLVLLIKDMYGKRYEKIYNSLYWSFILCFIVSTLLQMTNIADFFETVFLTHIAIGVSLVVIFFTLCEEIFKFKNKNAISITLVFVILIISAVLDFYDFYKNNFSDVSTYLTIGLVLCIFILGRLMIYGTFKMVKLGKKAKLFEELAFIDLLTKGKNRTAFNVHVEKLDESIADLSDVVIIVFDLNCLKLINDTMGHSIGDEAIIKCYECINCSFNRVGTCYRLGGDEFVSILENCTDEELIKIIERLETNISEYNKGCNYKLSIAYGYARFDKNIDKDITSLFNRADKCMYEKKKEMKSKYNPCMRK